MRLQLTLILLVALAYQILTISLYRFGPVGPDLVLLVVAYVALHETFRRALAAALFAGLAVDLVSLEPWGLFAAGYAAAVTVIALGRRRGWNVDSLPRIVLSCLAVTALSAVRLGITWNGDLADAGLVWTAAGAAYTVALSPAVYGILDPLKSRFVSPDYRRLW